MWPYKNITQKEFEKKKDQVQQMIVELGGEIQNFIFPYENKTISILEKNKTVSEESVRPILKYGEEYFRVSEVCFHKPFIVIEYGTYNDVINNTMIDAEPFPFDLSDELLLNEVKYALGILPYPIE